LQNYILIRLSGFRAARLMPPRAKLARIRVYLASPQTVIAFSTWFSSEPLSKFAESGEMKF
jgi:hypothetical protein